ncbi:MAG TPA: hypothetical protein VGQ93_02320 [Lysobacter sp.]|nr:hypothetical protein [Lysobacter sp.]
MRLTAEVGLVEGEGLKPVDRAELERQREKRRLEREREDADAAAK